MATEFSCLFGIERKVIVEKIKISFEYNGIDAGKHTRFRRKLC